MSIFNKRIFPDQQFADRDVGQPPAQAGPRAPKTSDDAGADFPSYGQATGGSDMAPDKAWDPQADSVPPEDAGARLFVPQHAKVPSSPPPRLPKIEPPADLINTYVETVDHNLSRSLGSPAHAVLVDNLSNQWLWFPAARRWVPPYIWGAVLPLFQATEIAEYRVEAPPTFVGGALHATQYVVTMWTAAMQFASTGSTAPAGIA